MLAWSDGLAHFWTGCRAGRRVAGSAAAAQAVAVGGTAAALHCRHRFSLVVDQVTPFLRDTFEEVTHALESWEGWITNRANPPVLILGERGGVDLGLRQLRRSVPLQTTVVDGLVVPTALEALRVKAFLVATRRATRDYVDVTALSRRVGFDAAVRALIYLNLVYGEGGRQTSLTQFAEACESEPTDLRAVALSAYKGLVAPFTDWPFVAQFCQRLGRALLKLELEGGLPRALDSGFGRGEGAT